MVLTEKSGSLTYFDLPLDPGPLQVLYDGSRPRDETAPFFDEVELRGVLYGSPAPYRTLIT